MKTRRPAVRTFRLIWRMNKMFDPEYDTPLTNEQCELSERTFLKKVGCKDMKSFLKAMEDCNYNVNEFNKRMSEARRH